MVFSARKTTRKQASTALEMAHQVDAPLVGAVLNGVPLAKGLQLLQLRHIRPVDRPGGCRNAERTTPRRQQRHKAVQSKSPHLTVLAAQR